MHTKVQNNMAFIWVMEISFFSIPHLGKLGKWYVKIFS